MKNYQTQVWRVGTAGHTTPEKAKKDPGRGTQEAALVLPDTVSVAVRVLTSELEESLLAFVVAAGLKVVNAIMKLERETLVGPKGRHDPSWVALRHGSDDGVVTLAGCQVEITRLRVRSADRTSEVHLATYDCFASSELLGRMGMEKILAKVSAFRYGVGLEPVGAAVEARSRGAVSRRFVASTEPRSTA